MLAIFAAIVPIVASVYAAGSLLVEHAQRSHNARSFDRVNARIQGQLRALEAERPMLDVHVFNRRSHEILERRVLLLELNGLDPATGTWGAMRRVGAPEGFSAAEVRRQWALLLGSIAGIALLALDAL